jgi:serine/threonine protein kinase
VKYSQDRVSNTRIVLIELLGATQFLHKHGWIHGDIKPPNVGIRNWSSSSRSILLLDLDDAEKSPPPATTTPPRPGTGGTIGWLAPERELEGYNETVDTWSIGVLALWMINRRSPWGFSKNPWNPDPNCARLRAAFQRTYKDCTIDLDLRDLTLRNVVLGMLRYPYAETSQQRLPRFTAREALDTLLEERDRHEHLNKRSRAA